MRSRKGTGSRLDTVARTASGPSPRVHREGLRLAEEEALRDELADRREVGLPGPSGVEVEQLGHRVQDLPEGEVAVAGTHQGGLDGVGLPGPAQAALLAQHD